MKKSIEEQVAELTEEQKNKIPKIGKTAVIVQIVIAVPYLIMQVLSLFAMRDLKKYIDYSEYDRFWSGYTIFTVIGAVLVIGVVVFVKLMYPYYSDAKYRYIKEQKKSGKK